jgi:hypothetical protein
MAETYTLKGKAWALSASERQQSMVVTHILKDRGQAVSRLETYVRYCSHSLLKEPRRGV